MPTYTFYATASTTEGSGTVASFAHESPASVDPTTFHEAHADATDGKFSRQSTNGGQFQARCERHTAWKEVGTDIPMATKLAGDLITTAVVIKATGRSSLREEDQDSAEISAAGARLYNTATQSYTTSGNYRTTGSFIFTDQPTFAEASIGSWAASPGLPPISLFQSATFALGIRPQIDATGSGAAGATFDITQILIEVTVTEPPELPTPSKLYAYNGAAFSPFSDRMDEGPLDFLGFWNSNGRFNSYGRTNGWRVALRRYWPEYASGLVAATTGTSTGWTATGVDEGFWTPADATWLTEGAPAFFDQFFATPANTGNKLMTDLPTRYLYREAESAVLFNDHQRYLLMNTTHPFHIVGTEFEFELTYGIFEGSGSGFIHPVIATGVTTLTEVGADIPTDAAPADAVQHVSLFYTPASEVALKLSPAEFGANIRGELILLYQRVFIPARTSGFSVSLAYSVGGASMRDLAIAAGVTDPADAQAGMSRTQLQFLFEMVTKRQRDLGWEPMLVLLTGEAWNQRNESLGSVGPLLVSDGDSPEAYLDSFNAWRDLVQDVWATDCGYSPANLLIINEIEHPANPTDSEMDSYRAPAIADALVTSNRTVCVDTPEVLPAEYLTFYSLYYGDGLGANQAHMADAGYNTMHSQTLDCILDAYLTPAQRSSGSSIVHSPRVLRPGYHD